MGLATSSQIADVAATESAGTSTTVPRGDHVHADPAFAAWTSYTPTFTNVTSGTGDFAYMRVGKTLHFRGGFTTGTATASGSIQFSLPSGVTAIGTAQPIRAVNGNPTVSARVGGSGTTAVVFADAAGTLWGVGASLVNLRVAGTIEIT